MKLVLIAVTLSVFASTMVLAFPNRSVPNRRGPNRSVQNRSGSNSQLTNPEVLRGVKEGLAFQLALPDSLRGFKILAYQALSALNSMEGKPTPNPARFNLRQEYIPTQNPYKNNAEQIVLYGGFFSPILKAVLSPSESS